MKLKWWAKLKSKTVEVHYAPEPDDDVAQAHAVEWPWLVEGDDAHEWALEEDVR